MLDFSAGNFIILIYYVLTSDQEITKANGIVAFNELVWHQVIPTMETTIYNKDAGFFVAPFTGIYFISIQIFRRDGTPGTFEVIVQQDVYIRVETATPTAADKVSMASYSAPVYLQKGYTVHVNVPWLGTISAGDKSSFFSVKLVSIWDVQGSEIPISAARSATGNRRPSDPKEFLGKHGHGDL